MVASKQYVATHQFLPSSDLKQSCPHSLLSLQIGDLIEITSFVNSDWAFGRTLGSTDPALFPLNYTRPVNTIDQLEINTLNFANLWLRQTKSSYASGASETEIDHKLELVSNLASTLELEYDSNPPKRIFSTVQTNCEEFGLGLYLGDKGTCQRLTVEEHEFDELLKLVKQKRLELSGKKSALSATDDERIYSLLIRLNFVFNVPIKHIDSELIVSFVSVDNQAPLFESYSISDLANPEPIYLLLRDCNPLLLNSLQLKIDIFVPQLQNLPGFFVDESQHEMLIYKQTLQSPLRNSNGVFYRKINFVPSNDANQACRVCLKGELLVHKEEELVEVELRERQLKLKCRSLFPLNPKPARLASSGRDNIVLMFDLSGMPSADNQQFDRFHLIVQLIDLHGNVIKDVFIDSTTYNTKGLPIERSSTTKTSLRYFMFALKDKLRLHLEIKLSKNVGSNAHLRLLFYGSNTEGRLFGNLPIYVAFMRLIENDILIGMGSTDLFLHKVDSTASLVSLRYLKLAGTKRDQKNNVNVVENESITPSIHVHISTLSINFTHDLNVLALLKCSDKTQIIRAINQLSSISSDFSLFLSRLLHNLFEKLGTDDELNRAVFGFVIWLLKRADYPMETYLKCVMDRELSTLNNPRVYGPFFNLLNSSLIPTNLTEQAAATWIDTIRGCPSIARIIILSALSVPKSTRGTSNTVVPMLEDLKSKFTSLLNNLIANLRDKGSQLPDHQWIHLRNIPNMLDVLFEYGVFDAASLALLCTELLQVVPPSMELARMEIIRVTTKTILFRNQQIRCKVLFPKFMSIIVEGLATASKKREKWSKLLNSIVTLLLNILHLLRGNLHESNQSIRTEVVFIASNCLLPIIRCCNASVYDGHEETQMISQTLFINFIDLIDANMFIAYLKSFRDEAQISDMLNEFLKALRAFTEASNVQIFNETIIKLALHRQCIKYAAFFKSALFGDRTFGTFQVTLWKELMHVLHSYLMNTSNSSAISLYMREEITLQSQAIECLRSLWFSLPISKKLTLGRNMLESVLDLLSSTHSHQFNCVLLAMFGDIVKSEGYYYSEQTKECPAQSFNVYKLLHSKLMKRPANLTNRANLCSEMEEELRSVVLCDQKFTSIKMLNLLPRFLELIHFGREALHGNNPYEIGLVYYKLLEFWYEIDERDLIVEYILRLYQYQKNRDELVEAAFSLQIYAVRLSWTNHQTGPSELITLSKRMQLNTDIESEIKEHLYWIICDLFGKAKFWELALPLLKDLSKHYETERIDYERLSSVMDRLRDYYHLIATQLRLNISYFVVGFYGSQQPQYLLNKKFIFRGRPDDRLDTFRQRISEKFGCELHHSLDDEPERLAQMSGKIATVDWPVPTNEYLRLSNADNPLLSLFYRHNFVDTFLLTRPLIRKESSWTEKFGVNDITKIWIRRTEFRLNQTLPSTLPIREVFEEKELELLNPLQTACMNISNSNDDLGFYAQMVDYGFGTTYLNSLLGQLRGILQAFVGGGVENYKVFLSDDVDEILMQDGLLTDKEQLKALLMKQLKLLDRGLHINGCHLNDASKLLHESLVDSFGDYHRMIEQICGGDFTASLVQKTNTNFCGRRKHASYLSRLSIDNSLMASEIKLSEQQRSTPVTSPTNTPIKQKLLNTDTPPLPPRRSNRHSSTFLHNH